MNVFSELLIQFIIATGVAAVAYGIIERTNAEHLRRLSAWLSVRGDRIFFALAIGYVCIFIALTLMRYLAFRTGYLNVPTAWDLALYDQMLWNTLNGRITENSFIVDAASFLGKSFTPMMLAFVPLYALWSSPIVLLVVQTLAIASAALPIFWFARARLGYGMALAVALAFFLSPMVENVNMTEFHETALEIPALAFTLFFLLRRQYKEFLICLALALLVKEEIALITIALGVYVFLVQRRRSLGSALALFGASWGYLLLQHIIPTLRGSEFGTGFYYFTQGATGGGARYGYLGRTLPEIISTVLTRPDIVWAHVVISEKITFVLQILVPLLFIPFVGLEIAVLTLPTFGYSLLSTYGLQYEIRSFYSAPLVPLLFFALVLGIERLIRCGNPKRNPAAWRGALAVGLVVSSGLSYYLQSPGPFARYFQPERYNWNAHTILGNQLLSQIPSDAIVIAQNEFMAHVSNRRWLYEIPVIPDYRQADYVFGDSTAPWYRVHLPAWEGYRQIGYFETIVERDGFWFAKRRTPDYRLALRYGDLLTLTGYSIVPTDTLRGGETFRPVFEWRVEQPSAAPVILTARVIDARGHLWAEESHLLHNGATKLTTDQVNKSLGEQSVLRLPPTMPAGEYALTLSAQISGTATALSVRDASNQALGDDPLVARVRIEKDQRAYTASQLPIEQPLFVDLRELRFLGSTFLPAMIRAGDELQVGLYWRARSQPPIDYVVAVQLRDATGRVAIEHAAQPANDTYPTARWRAGEVLLDWHDLQIPNDFARGTYQIVVVLRSAATHAAVGETLISALSVVD